ncbi:MAG: hypothetical protein OXG15_04950, partial [Gammaproteobacteria bacterium]|nr:hypothetical protein [Gammaproteobacteria bacterium]
NYRSHCNQKVWTKLGTPQCGMYVLHLIPLLAMLELLWIFGESRKCLHDRWSRTIVINTSSQMV